eukprot:TRINITY_DN236_c0_g1_i5.p1 TRINITY_DN236_c0_g1~~TRINITY_DN236_c0_g1_i5.p1  ORF type:complete len:541 (-),score=183.15 TRINITY_DN236_c0_g1_i5:81-1703(-)
MRDHRGGEEDEGGAEYMASIFCTEKDKVNCSFYFKIGACRHGERCSRIHNIPSLSPTVMMPNLYLDPQQKQLALGVEDPQITEKVLQEDFEEFYLDMWEELSKYGEIDDLVVCSNLGEHLLGNVYVKYFEEQHAEDALKDLKGRFYDKRPILPEFSPVTNFREAKCRQFEKQGCNRGGFCNFMHMRPIDRSLKNELIRKCGGKRSRSRSRSRDRYDDRRDRRSRDRYDDRRERRSSRDRSHERRRSRDRSYERRRSRDRSYERRSREKRSSRERRSSREDRYKDEKRSEHPSSSSSTHPPSENQPTSTSSVVGENRDDRQRDDRYKDERRDERRDDRHRDERHRDERRNRSQSPKKRKTSRDRSAERTVTKRSRCYFDVEIDNKPAGRIVFELFDEVVPLTCKNFYSLCVGNTLSKNTGKPLHYKGSKFHRIIPNFMVQGGDITLGNGRGGESIYGSSFKDENFIMKHDKPFLLSMANAGKDTNSSQFFLTTVVCDWLDNKHTVFGEVIDGQDIVKNIEREGSEKGTPLKNVVISNSGGL